MFASYNGSPKISKLVKWLRPRQL